MTCKQPPNRHMEKIAVLTLLSLWIGCSLRAGEAGPGIQDSLARVDKAAYHLFNPTPREYLREMVADRPDKTESPYTVDAGHFQVETDLVSYTRDHDTAQ